MIRVKHGYLRESKCYFLETTKYCTYGKSSLSLKISDYDYVNIILIIALVGCLSIKFKKLCIAKKGWTNGFEILLL